MCSFNLTLQIGKYDGNIARIALVTERRGFFITSLNLTSLTDDIYVVRLRLEGDPQRFEQTCKQLSKLVDVIDLEVVKTEKSNAIAA